jgi:hypothetical protein
LREKEEEGKEPQIREDKNKKTRMDKLKFIAHVSINACPKHDGSKKQRSGLNQ